MTMTKKLPTAAKPLAARRDVLRAGKRDTEQNYVLVIHGGAGTMNRQGSTLEERAKYRAVLIDALKAGHEVLKLGGEAMDAAVAAITVLEGKCDCIEHAHPFRSSRQSAGTSKQDDFGWHMLVSYAR